MFHYTFAHALIWAAVLFIIQLLTFLYLHQRRALKRARAANEKLRLDRRTAQLTSRRKNVGKRIYKALYKAGEKNPTGQIAVTCFEDNGGDFSINVKHLRPDMWRHLCPCFQLDVQTIGNETYVHYLRGAYGAYGGETMHDANEDAPVDALIPELVERTKRYGVDYKYA